MIPLTVGQQLEVTAERLAFGGFAVARHDGVAVFVPFAAPGDRLRVEVTEVNKSFVRASIVELLAPGPARVAPRCVHFGECGGCQYQHVDYAAQVAAKSDAIRDALVRANESLSRASDGAIDLRSVAFVTLLGGAGYQLLHGRFLPAGGAMVMQALDLLFGRRAYGRE